MHGADEQHRPRSEAVGGLARHQPEPEVPRRRDREHQRRRALAGAELLGHRVEERPEAVDDAEHHERAEERRRDDDPPPRRVRPPARPPPPGSCQ